MDTREFTELIRRHTRLLHQIAYTYCRDAASREDVIQEITLELWRSRHRYDERYKETTWIYRIAVNVAISFHRRERRHRDRRQPIDARAFTVAAPEGQPSEEMQVLMRCIDGLAPLDKALVLLYLDGNEHATLAEVLGISVSNVGTKLSRIKERLRTDVERRSQPSPKPEGEERHAAG